MMGKPDLEAWFYSLELDALLKIFTWPDWCQDCNDFIDACDERWGEMDEEGREHMYVTFHNWF